MNVCADTRVIKYYMLYLRVAGFEPATTCTQNRYATKLRYTLEINAYPGGFEPPASRVET